LLARGISETMTCIAFGLVLALACLVLHGLLEAWRERLRAEADHGVALLASEFDVLRPHLSFFGVRVVDERHGYRDV
jgi:biopolymer transport protein ExbB/TolQ